MKTAPSSPLSFSRAATAVLLSLIAGTTQSAVEMAAANPDKKPPQDASGAAIPEKVPADGGLCWADPSIEGVNGDRTVTSEFGGVRKEGSSPHAGTDIRAKMGSPLYAVADGCVSFGNPTAKQLVGVKIRINDKFPNSSVWYLHMSRVAPKFINDGRSKACIPVKKGELVGYSGGYGGTGGVVKPAFPAHLHLSYFVSGLMINPLPYVGSPKAGQKEYNTVRDGSSLSGGGASDGDASATSGYKLGFAVPRMCNIYTVKDTGGKTIPYNGTFGTGNYTANATAPSQAELEKGAKEVRQSMGIQADGKAPEGVLIDKTNEWPGGMPEAPDWDSYKEMSAEQILDAEVTRRSANSRWVESLAEQSERGLAVEEIWLRALRMQVRVELNQSKQRTQAMLAAYLALQARKQIPDPESALQKAAKSPIR